MSSAVQRGRGTKAALDMKHSQECYNALQIVAHSHVFSYMADDKTAYRHLPIEVCSHALHRGLKAVSKLAYTVARTPIVSSVLRLSLGCRIGNPTQLLTTVTGMKIIDSNNHTSPCMVRRTPASHHSSIDKLITYAHFGRENILFEA
jgi:hypothetical protein